MMLFSITACGKKVDDSSDWEWVEEVSYITISSGDTNPDNTGDGNNNTATESNTSGEVSHSQGGKVTTTTKNGGGSNADRPIASEQVSKADLKGYTFTLLSPYLAQKATATSTGFEKNFFQRKDEVEKEYGCTIKIINPGVACNVAYLQPLMAAGKKVADVMEILATDIASLASANYIVPWDDVANVEIDNSKWISGYTSLATFDNKHYGLQFMKPPEARMCVVFNKTLLNSSGVDANGLYDLVNNKQWTFAKLQEYAKAATKVSGGTTVSYGVGGTPYKVMMALGLGNGGHLVTYANGKATATYTSNNIINATEFFNELVNKDKVYQVPEELKKETTVASLADSYYRDAFLTGKTAFLIEESWVINQQVKPKAGFDYGILPVPMGPDNKTGNYICSADNARIFTMTSTNAKNKDVAKSVAIFNALSTPSEGYEGNDWWEYDVKSEYFQKGSADKDLAMYKLCLNTSTIDIGWSVKTLKDGYMNNGVYGPIFQSNGHTPKAGINSISGTYDKLVNATFNQ